MSSEDRHERYRGHDDHEKDRDRDRYRDRDYDRDRYYEDRKRRERRRSEAPLSPIIDFGKIQKSWTGWDNPIPRFVPGGSFGNQASGNSNDSNSQIGLGHITGTEAYQRQQLRLYVGNLPPVIDEANLLEFLNRAMLQLPPGYVKENEPPVLNVEMSQERNYCFVELRSANEATYMTALDGIIYNGVSLRIRRPKEWKPTGNEPSLPVIQHENIISTTVDDSPHKIFIGGIPLQFSESEVKELLTVFGQLRAFNLVENGTSKFAFCEFVDVSFTDKACLTLNGASVAGKKLIVQRSRPTVNKDGTRESNSVPEIFNRNQVFTTNEEGRHTLLHEKQGGYPLIQNILSSYVPLLTIQTFLLDQDPELAEGKPTKILVLLNVLDITTEWTEDYYEAVMEDINIEAKKYGNVVSVTIPRQTKKTTESNVNSLINKQENANGKDEDHKDGDNVMEGENHTSSNEQNSGNLVSNSSSNHYDDNLDGNNESQFPPGFGRVFITYETPAQSKVAQTNLQGQRYDGRVIITSFVEHIPS